MLFVAGVAEGDVIARAGVDGVVCPWSPPTMSPPMPWKSRMSSPASPSMKSLLREVVDRVVALPRPKMASSPIAPAERSVLLLLLHRIVAFAGVDRSRPRASAASPAWMLLSPRPRSTLSAPGRCSMKPSPSKLFYQVRARKPPNSRLLPRRALDAVVAVAAVDEVVALARRRRCRRPPRRSGRLRWCRRSPRRRRRR